MSDFFVVGKIVARDEIRKSSTSLAVRKRKANLLAYCTLKKTNLQAITILKLG